MKFLKPMAIILTLMLTLTACSTKGEDSQKQEDPVLSDAVKIQLSDEKITIDGETATTENTSPVYIANDIVYYEDGKDFTYGEGTEKDAHTKEEAAEHTVVHITKAGKYALSGNLSKGQIAVDLGEDAEENESAVVTLVLNNVDITCEVAPAVIFYNVYECGEKDTEKASKDVDTSKAGANVIVADGTENTVNGSYVEKIYKPDTVELNEEKTEVEEAKKLHKYDGAFYSKMSMNVTGGSKNTGVLTINAENEGLDSELHLTINGGIININSGNDGINTNEDGLSVTTINNGELHINVTGTTGEGDGIDSNGWLVINGGSVRASACAKSADAGIDSDMGIHINGGTVLATGNMLDKIEDGGQNYAVFTFSQKQDGGNGLLLKNSENKTVLEAIQENAYSILIFSSPELVEGTYTLWSGEKQLSGYSGGVNMQGGMMPQGEMPEGQEPPEGFEFPEMPEGAPPVESGERPQFNGEKPEGFEALQNMERPEGEEPPQMPNGERPERPDGQQNGGFNQNSNLESSTEFKIQNGGNMFNI